MKFCVLASGKADLYPRMGTTMQWDTAAGDAILRAAGGTVVTLDGRPLTYGPGGEIRRRGLPQSVVRRRPAASRLCRRRRTEILFRHLPVCREIARLPALKKGCFMLGGGRGTG